MKQLLIRNLDDAVVDALRQRAVACGTSTEEQARRALTAAVGLERETLIRRLAELRESIGAIPGPSSLEDLRRDRDRDNA